MSPPHLQDRDLVRAREDSRIRCATTRGTPAASRECEGSRPTLARIGMPPRARPREPASARPLALAAVLRYERTVSPSIQHPPTVAPSQPAIDGWLHPDFDGVAATLRAQ